MSAFKMASRIVFYLFSNVRDICRCADAGYEPVSTRCQVVQAVYSRHAQDGRQRAAGLVVQAQESQGLVAFPRQERGRGDGTHGSIYESRRYDTIRYEISWCLRLIRSTWTELKRSSWTRINSSGNVHSARTNWTQTVLVYCSQSSRDASCNWVDLLQVSSV